MRGATDYRQQCDMYSYVLVDYFFFFLGPSGLPACFRTSTMPASQSDNAFESYMRMPSLASGRRGGGSCHGSAYSTAPCAANAAATVLPSSAASDWFCNLQKFLSV